MLYKAISAGSHFALTRYGDGEAAILQGREIDTGPTNRLWSWRPSRGIGDADFSRELECAFQFDHPRYCVGISCPCCAPRDYTYYASRLSNSRLANRITYANIFSNGNWSSLAQRLLSLVRASGRTIVLVTHWDKNFRLARSRLCNNLVQVAPISHRDYDTPIGSSPGGALFWYCVEREIIRRRFEELAVSVTDAIFFVQAGPVANILIHTMFLKNSANTYLDMGHSLDPILFDDPSRPFHLAQKSASCADMDVDWQIE